MPTLFNVTDQVIKPQHGGAYYVFKPGEKKEVFDAYAAKHILNRWGKFGIVELSYGEKESKQYLDYEEYEHAQKILGWQTLLDTMNARLFNFDVYQEACGDKKSVYRQQITKQEQMHKIETKRVEGIVESLTSMNMRKTPEQRAEAMLAKARELEQEAMKLLGTDEHKPMQIPKKESLSGGHASKSH